jgi:hypoxanthine phosphoribosyltransferase
VKKLSFETIAAKLRRHRFPAVDLVVGVASGGLVPAALVAQLLGKEARFITINYRDERNQPRRPAPAVLAPLRLPKAAKRILLVDDVAVTGQTLALARRRLGSRLVTTFVLTGQADHVLFPEIRECVAWPWKSNGR